ncbi:hypothetical protein AAJ76_2600044091 [Vairimorpha ceranae]|uniref:Uncharacterized protein n=1 Tax=Vairimorpha ceranae TaxID=40302 RepID=A0A0F9WCT8_9MICR|nr:hypothetical protein AAJ76_2600044091 [Vairimorpha ceranae]KKO75281.1 hypothetical protein AAJ76_2600044091 [Vairimorpha ceranae]
MLLDELKDNKITYDLLLIIYCYKNRILITVDQYKFINLCVKKCDDKTYDMWNKIKKQNKFIILI